MNSRNNDDDRDRRVILYLALMLPILLGACGGLSLLSYVFPSSPPSRPSASGAMAAPAGLLVIGAFIAAATGLLSGMISDWLYERVGQAPPHTRKVILLAAALTYILLVVGGLFISLIQSGA